MSKPHGSAPPSPPAETPARFLSRWSWRKHEARAGATPVEPVTSIPEAPSAPAKVLTDADMPPIESLNADSDYSGFMSPGVSEDVRKRALRKLFTLPGIGERDALDGEYYDCHGFEPLGDVITHEMREEMEREAQNAKPEPEQTPLEPEETPITAAEESSDPEPVTEPLASTSKLRRKRRPV